jgi:glycosyltransferase involved in cell wall biosynthesis
MSDKITVIIPAFNEEDAIGKVIEEIPKNIQSIFVVDNGSTDKTAEIAANKDSRVTVLFEPVRGYGKACQRGILEISKSNPDIVVFLDGDYSDCPSEMNSLIEPIQDGKNDMIIGSRVIGDAEKGALLPQARLGNFLASILIKFFYGFKYTDLGPFRAIAFPALKKLKIKDQSFGITVEMQVKAVKAKLKIGEVPVSYKKRIGKSKITGTFKGSFLAGTMIIGTIFRYLFWKPEN